MTSPPSRRKRCGSCSPTSHEVPPGRQHPRRMGVVRSCGPRANRQVDRRYDQGPASGQRRTSRLLTSPIPELGFVRVSVQRTAGRVTVEAAGDVLAGMLRGLGAHHAFLPDDQSAIRFPEWCRQASSTTDAHLLDLAKTHGARLATLDERIPGAFRRFRLARVTRLRQRVGHERTGKAGLNAPDLHHDVLLPPRAGRSSCRTARAQGARRCRGSRRCTCRGRAAAAARPARSAASPR